MAYNLSEYSIAADYVQAFVQVQGEIAILSNAYEEVKGDATNTKTVLEAEFATMKTTLETNIQQLESDHAILWSYVQSLAAQNGATAGHMSGGGGDWGKGSKPITDRKGFE